MKYRNMNQAALKNLDLVDAAKKKYEDISIKKDPVFNDVIEAIKIVKDFIRRKGLIIYGGTAIDFALRLKGDAIYTNESLLFPDLDFFSPDSVSDAYELSILLHRAGWTDSRAIVATYVRTMRVDIEKNHFIADITYLNPAVFANIKTIEFDGMKVLPPEFQKIDLHLSLSYPFDKPPQEVIFERWKKDIERYNLLDKYYPAETTKIDIINRQKVTIPLESWVHSTLFNGFGAYSMISAAYTDLVALGDKLRLNCMKNDSFVGKAAGIIPHIFTIDEDRPQVTFETITNVPVCFSSYKSDETAKILFDDKFQHFAPLLKLIEDNFEGKLKSGQLCRIYRADFQLTSCSVYKVIWDKKSDEYIKIRCVNIQLILAYFLSMAELSKLGRSDKIYSDGAGQKGDDYKLFNSYYVSTKNMIDNSIEITNEIFRKICGKNDSDLIKRFTLFNMFMPSIIVAGIKNQSETYFSSLINLDKMRGIIHENEDENNNKNDKTKEKISYDLPVNFYPCRFFQRIGEEEAKNTLEVEGLKDKLPKFDYSLSKFFLKNGELF